MNLLTDPLPPILDGAERRQALDLPSLLAAYARDEVVDLPFLRRHQQMPWHIFCVQLAALALHRAGEEAVVDDVETWRRLLRALTPEWPEDEPWKLVVEDVTQPAFMQPPVPPGTTDPHKNPVSAADDLDVLVTSKNHGVKQAIAHSASPAAWIAALVQLQTTGGFLGAGNYGVARMNRGFATRPFTGLVPSGGPGAHWRRDVSVMLKNRDWFFERVETFAEEGGAALLWCVPWDETHRLDLGELDPWFIEVCRRVRLYRETDGVLRARSVGSKVSRIEAKAYRGNVGDPWIPIKLEKEPAAYNVQPGYAVMAEVMFRRNRWLRPLLLDWHDDIDRIPSNARFDVFVRGRSKTEGLHRRDIPIHNHQRRRFFASTEDRDEAAKVAREMVEHAGELRRRILKPALFSLVQAGRSDLNFRDRTSGDWAETWLNTLELAIEADFFERLFAVLETGEWRRWVELLEQTGKAVLEDAIAAMPITGPRRLKAITAAETRFRTDFKKAFGGYLQVEEEMANA